MNTETGQEVQNTGELFTKEVFDRGIVFPGEDIRIAKVMQRAKRGEKLKVAFLGGSITQGSLSSTPELCYAYLTYEYWKNTFPNAEITYINAGIGGTTSHLGVGRVEEEVLSKQPDFVIVEFSVNDADNDPHFQETYESLVRRILSAKGEPALLLVHNVRYDDGGNAEAIHRPVGAHYGVPSVAVRPVIYEMTKSGKLDRRMVTPDDLHPNDLGHYLVSRVIINYLETVREKAEAEDGEKILAKADPFLPLPAPLTQSAYEAAVRRRNDDLVPILAEGFEADDTPQSCVSDCFKKGWKAKDKGARIVFEAEGTCLAVQYRKTVRKPAPVAHLILDGDLAHPVCLDANFEETWGDCLYLETILEHGERKKHTVEIQIVEASPEDRECFYLVSLITA